MGRVFRFGVALTLLITGVAAFAACGIDESGLLGDDASIDNVVPTDGGGDTSPFDAPVDNYVALTCDQADAGLDASCIPPYPAGWTPIAYQIDSGITGCPGDAGDYAFESWITNATVLNTTCYCSPCNASSSWACPATLAAGIGCGEEFTFVDASTGCWDVAHHSASATTTLTGFAGCSGGATQGNNEAGTTSLAACVPQRCSDDFCGLAPPFKLCVYTPTEDAGCPAGFPNAHGAASDVAVKCNPCTTCALQNVDAGCTGTMTEYPNAGCTGTPLGTGAADGSCVTETNSASYGSVGYKGVIPTPNCGGGVGGPSGGSLTFNGAVTICCP